MSGKRLGAFLVICAVVILTIVLVVALRDRRADEIRIGVIAPLSGGSAKYGEDIRRGYALAADEINAGGGINGKTLRLIYEDSEGKPEKAVSAAQKLIHSDHVVAILGPLWSSPTLAVAPIAERDKVVLLSSGASSPEITGAGDYIFRNELSDQDGAEQSARLFFEAGYKRIAMLYINNDFGIGYRDVTRRTYEELGGTVAVAEAFEQDAKDFRTQLLKVKEADPEAVFLVGYKEMILILRQMRELGINKQILSIALFEDPEILEKVGEVAEGAIYTYYGTFDPKSQDQDIRKFVTAFEKEYGEPPEYYAPLGYDAVNILAQAIREGGTEPNGIKDALYQVKDFPGLTGATTIDENGDVQRSVILKTVKNGRFDRYGGESTPPGTNTHHVGFHPPAPEWSKVPL